MAGISKESAAALLRAGGHLRMPALAKESLVELARIAHGSGARLEIVGNLSVDSMMEIVRAGGGSVLFDVSR